MDKKKTILILATLLQLMTVAGQVLLAVFSDGYAGRAHLLVPVFFLILYAVPVALMPQPLDAKQFFKRFMIFKSLKLALSIAVLFAICLVFREQSTVVLVTFLIYSFAMMFVENIYVLKLKNKISKSV